MRARFTRILLFFTCLAIVAPLSGPMPMMAQEAGVGEGMVYCHCHSDDASMELEFPAAGGPVQGRYVSSYTVTDTSLLYDEDGSAEYYEEERSIDVSIHLGGSYLDVHSGSFPVRISGSARADIDNLEDDRFDRSYRAELNGTATVVLNAAGTITVESISAGFTSVEKEANEIPNTEWSEPPSTLIADSLSLVCTTRPAVPVPPQTSCTITTMPDRIGPGDTTFQARVVPAGFGADKPLRFEWELIGPVGTRGSGQNPTVVWPGGATFASGFYTLRAMVTDGQYAAYCSRHWSLPGGQNKAPECEIVDVGPSAPWAGTTSLMVSVEARDDDGDPLKYESILAQGASQLGWSPSDAGARHLVSVLSPGGLASGGHTMLAFVDDGKQTAVCSRNFFVSEIAGPSGTAQPQPAVQPGVPPAPPSPPVPSPEPPGPPAAPTPSGGCGPVQIIYLDDLGIKPDQAGIDSFIENALAQRGPDYSLVVSHRQRLVDKFGSQGFQQIDSLLGNLGNIAETCPFVLIVGDDDVVPLGILANPTDDGDVLFTDDLYGDNDHDELSLPDIPVARIPDGNSLELLLTQLSPSSLPEEGNLTLANSKRPHADGVASQTFGTGRILLWSLPTRHTNLDGSQVNVRHTYFMLHGTYWDTRIWWGEEDTYPEAFTVAEARSQGIVLGGACYGGYTFNRAPDDSISLAFLASGARAFVGATGITYSPIWTAGPEPTGPMRHDAAFHYAFLDALSRGQAPLAGFMEAKREMAKLAGGEDGTAAELKMLHEFLYFGKP